MTWEFLVVNGNPVGIDSILAGVVRCQFYEIAGPAVRRRPSADFPPRRENPRNPLSHHDFRKLFYGQSAPQN
jgi:hypothetical protein